MADNQQNQPPEAEAPEEQALQQARGITREQYQRWRNHPVTLMFRQYLRDKTAELFEVTKEEWLSGTLNLQKEDDVRGYARAHIELSDLEFDAIALHYHQIDLAAKQAEEEESEDETETSQG